MANVVCSGCRHLKASGGNRFCFSEEAIKERKSAFPDALECRWRQERTEAARRAQRGFWRWWGRGSAAS